MNPLPPIQANVVEPATPRLGIIHLLLWMFASAVFLGIGQLFERGSHEGNQWWIFLIHRGVLAILTGAAVSGSLIFVAWLAQGKSFAIAPGHWLLLLITAGTLLQWFVNIVLWSLQQFARDAFQGPIPPHYFAYIATSGVMVVLGMIAFALCLRPLQWAAVFLVSTAGKGAMMLAWTFVVLQHQAAPKIGFIVGWTYHVSTAALILALAAAVLVDILTRARRDWLHYAAIGLCVGQVITSWVFQLALWLFPLRLEH